MIHTLKTLPRLIALIVVMLVLVNCSDKYKKVPDDKFVGLWELKGRSMFEGMQVRIEKNGNSLVGKIVKLNDNKIINMFMSENDVWVADIARRSNFEFKLTEKKVAKDLFSLYGLSTSQEYKAQFIDDNTFGLALESSDPLQSKILYKRIE